LKSETKTYRVGIVGYGYWGPNLARNIFEHGSFKLHSIADKDPKKQEKAKKQYPNIEIYSDAFDLINSNDVDVVVVATSVSQHYPVAKAALVNGKHVMLEKPACASYKDLLELKSIADKNHLVLMVDYTFLYNGAVFKFKNIIDSNDFGHLNYIDSTRINLGIFQTDINKKA
jgi:predicted dehydrogenase